MSGTSSASNENSKVYELKYRMGDNRSVIFTLEHPSGLDTTKKIKDCLYSIWDAETRRYHAKGKTFGNRENITIWGFDENTQRYVYENKEEGLNEGDLPAPKLTMHPTFDQAFAVHEFSLKTLNKEEPTIYTVIFDTLSAAFSLIFSPVTQLYKILSHQIFPKGQEPHEFVQNLGSANHKELLSQLRFLQSLFENVDAVAAKGSHILDDGDEEIPQKGGFALSSSDLTYREWFELNGRSFKEYFISLFADLSAPQKSGPPSAGRDKLTPTTTPCKRVAQILEDAHSIGTLIETARNANNRKERLKAIIKIEEKFECLKKGEINRLIVPFAFGDGNNSVSHFLIFERESGVIKHVTFSSPTLSKSTPAVTEYTIPSLLDGKMDQGKIKEFFEKLPSNIFYGNWGEKINQHVTPIHRFITQLVAISSCNDPKCPVDDQTGIDIYHLFKSADDDGLIDENKFQQTPYKIIEYFLCPEEQKGPHERNDFISRLLLTYARQDAPPYVPAGYKLPPVGADIKEECYYKRGPYTKVSRDPIKLLYTVIKNLDKERPLDFLASKATFLEAYMNHLVALLEEKSSTFSSRELEAIYVNLGKYLDELKHFLGKEVGKTAASQVVKPFADAIKKKLPDLKLTLVREDEQKKKLEQQPLIFTATLDSKIEEAIDPGNNQSVNLDDVDPSRVSHDDFNKVAELDNCFSTINAVAEESELPTTEEQQDQAEAQELFDTHLRAVVDRAVLDETAYNVSQIYLTGNTPPAIISQGFAPVLHEFIQKYNQAVGACPTPKALHQFQVVFLKEMNRSFARNVASKFLTEEFPKFTDNDKAFLAALESALSKNYFSDVREALVALQVDYPEQALLIEIIVQFNYCCDIHTTVLLKPLLIEKLAELPELLIIKILKKLPEGMLEEIPEGESGEIIRKGLEEILQDSTQETTEVIFKQIPEGMRREILLKLPPKEGYAMELASIVVQAIERRKAHQLLTDLDEVLEGLLQADTPQPKAAKVLAFAILKALPPLCRTDGTIQPVWDSLLTEEECDSWYKVIDKINTKFCESAILSQLFPINHAEMVEQNHLLFLSAFFFEKRMKLAERLFYNTFLFLDSDNPLDVETTKELDSMRERRLEELKKNVTKKREKELEKGWAIENEDYQEKRQKLYVGSLDKVEAWTRRYKGWSTDHERKRKEVCTGIRKLTAHPIDDDDLVSIFFVDEIKIASQFAIRFYKRELILQYKAIHAGDPTCLTDENDILRFQLVHGRCTEVIQTKAKDIIREALLISSKYNRDVRAQGSSQAVRLEAQHNHACQMAVECVRGSCFGSERVKSRIEVIFTENACVIRKDKLVGDAVKILSYSTSTQIQGKQDEDEKETRQRYEAALINSYKEKNALSTLTAEEMILVECCDLKYSTTQFRCEEEKLLFVMAKIEFPHTAHNRDSLIFAEAYQIFFPANALPRDSKDIALTLYYLTLPDDIKIFQLAICNGDIRDAKDELLHEKAYGAIFGTRAKQPKAIQTAFRPKPLKPPILWEQQQDVCITNAEVYLRQPENWARLGPKENITPDNVIALYHLDSRSEQPNARAPAEALLIQNYRLCHSAGPSYTEDEILWIAASIDLRYETEVEDWIKERQPIRNQVTRRELATVEVRDPEINRLVNVTFERELPFYFDSLETTFKGEVVKTISKNPSKAPIAHSSPLAYYARYFGLGLSFGNFPKKGVKQNDPFADEITVGAKDHSLLTQANPRLQKKERATQAAVRYHTLMETKRKNVVALPHRRELLRSVNDICNLIIKVEDRELNALRLDTADERILTQALPLPLNQTDFGQVVVQINRELTNFINALNQFQGIHPSDLQTLDAINVASIRTALTELHNNWGALSAVDLGYAINGETNGRITQLRHIQGLLFRLSVRGIYDDKSPLAISTKYLQDFAEGFNGSKPSKKTAQALFYGGFNKKEEGQGVVPFEVAMLTRFRAWKDLVNESNQGKECAVVKAKGFIDFNAMHRTTLRLKLKQMKRIDFEYCLPFPYTLQGLWIVDPTKDRRRGLPVIPLERDFFIITTGIRERELGLGVTVAHTEAFVCEQNIEGTKRTPERTTEVEVIKNIRRNNTPFPSTADQIMDFLSYLQVGRTSGDPYSSSATGNSNTLLSSWNVVACFEYLLHYHKSLGGSDREVQCHNCYNTLFKPGLLSQHLSESPDFYITWTPTINKMIQDCKNGGDKEVEIALFLLEICGRIKLIARDQEYATKANKDEGMAVASVLPGFDWNPGEEGTHESLLSTKFHTYENHPRQKLFATYFLSFHCHKPATRRSMDLWLNILKAYALFARSPSRGGHPAIRDEIFQKMHESLIPQLESLLLKEGQKKVANKNKFFNDLTGLVDSKITWERVSPYHWVASDGETSVDLITAVGIPINPIYKLRMALPESIIKDDLFKNLMGTLVKDIDPIIEAEKVKSKLDDMDGKMVDVERPREGKPTTTYKWKDEDASISFEIRSDDSKPKSYQIYQRVGECCYLYYRPKVDESGIAKILNFHNKAIENTINAYGAWILTEEKGIAIPNPTKAYVARDRQQLTHDPLCLHLDGNKVIGASIGEEDNLRWACSELAHNPISTLFSSSYQGAPRLLSFRDNEGLLFFSSDKKHVTEIHFPLDETARAEEEKDKRLVLLKKGEKWVVEGQTHLEWVLEGTKHLEEHFGESYREFLLPLHNSVTGEREYWIWPYIATSLGKRGGNPHFLKLTTLLDLEAVRSLHLDCKPIKFGIDSKHQEYGSHAAFLYIGLNCYLRGEHELAMVYLEKMVKCGSSKTTEEIQALRGVMWNYLIALADIFVTKKGLNDNSFSTAQTFFALKFVAALQQIDFSVVEDVVVTDIPPPNEILRIFGLLISPHYFSYLDGLYDKKSLIERNLALSEGEIIALEKACPPLAGCLMSVLKELRLDSKTEPLRLTTPEDHEIEKLIIATFTHIDPHPVATIEELNKKFGSELRGETLISNFWTFWQWISEGVVDYEELIILFNKIPDWAGNAEEVDIACRMLLCFWHYIRMPIDDEKKYGEIPDSFDAATEKIYGIRAQMPDFMSMEMRIHRYQSNLFACLKGFSRDGSVKALVQEVKNNDLSGVAATGVQGGTHLAAYLFAVTVTGFRQAAILQPERSLGRGIEVRTGKYIKYQKDAKVLFDTVVDACGKRARHGVAVFTPIDDFTPETCHHFSLGEATIQDRGARQLKLPKKELLSTAVRKALSIESLLKRLGFDPEKLDREALKLGLRGLKGAFLNAEVLGIALKENETWEKLFKFLFIGLPKVYEAALRPVSFEHFDREAHLQLASAMAHRLGFALDLFEYFSKGQLPDPKHQLPPLERLAQYSNLGSLVKDMQNAIREFLDEQDGANLENRCERILDIYCSSFTRGIEILQLVPEIRELDQGTLDSIAALNPATDLEEARLIPALGSLDPILLKKLIPLASILKALAGIDSGILKIVADINPSHLAKNMRIHCKPLLMDAWEISQNARREKQRALKAKQRVLLPQGGRLTGSKSSTYGPIRVEPGISPGIPVARAYNWSSYFDIIDKTDYWNDRINKHLSHFQPTDKDSPMVKSELQRHRKGLRLAILELKEKSSRVLKIDEIIQLGKNIAARVIDLAQEAKELKLGIFAFANEFQSELGLFSKYSEEELLDLILLMYKNGELNKIGMPQKQQEFEELITKFLLCSTEIQQLIKAQEVQQDLFEELKGLTAQVEKEKSDSHDNAELLRGLKEKAEEYKEIIAQLAIDHREDPTIAHHFNKKGGEELFKALLPLKDRLQFGEKSDLGRCFAILLNEHRIDELKKERQNESGPRKFAELKLEIRRLKGLRDPENLFYSVNEISRIQAEFFALAKEQLKEVGGLSDEEREGLQEVYDEASNFTDQEYGLYIAKLVQEGTAISSEKSLEDLLQGKFTPLLVEMRKGGEVTLKRALEICSRLLFATLERQEEWEKKIQRQDPSVDPVRMLAAASNSWITNSYKLISFLNEGSDRLRYCKKDPITGDYYIEQQEFSRRYLLTDYYQGTITRKKAAKAIEDLVKKTLNFIVLRMGLGKSTTVIPLAHEILLALGMIPVSGTTSALFDQFKSFMPKNAFEFNFDINYGLDFNILNDSLLSEDDRDKMIISHLENLRDNLYHIPARKCGIITTPARRGFLRDKRIELQNRLDLCIRNQGDRKERSRIFIKVELLKQIENFFKGDKIVLIGDEDVVQDPSLEYNFAIMESASPLDSYHVDCSFLILGLMLDNPILCPLLIGDKIRSLPDIQAPMRDLATLIVTDKKIVEDFWLHGDHAGFREDEWNMINKEELIEYLLGTRSDLPTGAEKWDDRLSDAEQKSKCYMAAFKKCFTATFKSTYKTHGNLGRGLQQTTGTGEGALVIPYKDGYPKPNHQYGNEAELILHQLLFYVAAKTKDKHFKKMGAVAERKFNRHFETLSYSAEPEWITWCGNIETRAHAAANGRKGDANDKRGDLFRAFWKKDLVHDAIHPSLEALAMVPAALDWKGFQDEMVNHKYFAYLQEETQVLIRNASLETVKRWATLSEEALAAELFPQDAKLQIPILVKIIQDVTHQKIKEISEEGGPIPPYINEIKKTISTESPAYLDRLKYLRYVMGIKDTKELDFIFFQEQATSNSQDLVAGRDARLASGTGNPYVLNLANGFTSQPDVIAGEVLLRVDLDEKVTVFQNPEEFIIEQVKNRKCHAIINTDFDTGPEAEVRSLREIAKRENLQRQFLFRADSKDGHKERAKFIWDPDSPRPTDYRTSEVSRTNAFGIYEPPDTRGVDFELPTESALEEVEGIAMLGIGTKEPLQPSGRLRKGGEGQIIRWACDEQLEARAHGILGNTAPLTHGGLYRAILHKTTQEDAHNNTKAACIAIQTPRKVRTDDVITMSSGLNLGIDSDRDTEVLEEIESILFLPHRGNYISTRSSWKMEYSPLERKDPIEFLQDVHIENLNKNCHSYTLFLEGLFNLAHRHQNWLLFTKHSMQEIEDAFLLMHGIDDRQDPKNSQKVREIRGEVRVHFGAVTESCLVAEKTNPRYAKNPLFKDKLEELDKKEVKFANQYLLFKAIFTAVAEIAKLDITAEDFEQQLQAIDQKFAERLELSLSILPEASDRLKWDKKLAAIAANKIYRMGRAFHYSQKEIELSLVKLQTDRKVEEYHRKNLPDVIEGTPQGTQNNEQQMEQQMQQLAQKEIEREQVGLTPKPLDQEPKLKHTNPLNYNEFKRETRSNTALSVGGTYASIGTLFTRENRSSHKYLANEYWRGKFSDTCISNRAANILQSGNKGGPIVDQLVVKVNGKTRICLVTRTDIEETVRPALYLERVRNPNVEVALFTFSTGNLSAPPSEKGGTAVVTTDDDCVRLMTLNKIWLGYEEYQDKELHYLIQMVAELYGPDLPLDFFNYVSVYQQRSYIEVIRNQLFTLLGDAGHEIRQSGSSEYRYTLKLIDDIRELLFLSSKEMQIVMTKIAQLKDNQGKRFIRPGDPILNRGMYKLGQARIELFCQLSWKQFSLIRGLFKKILDKAVKNPQKVHKKTTSSPSGFIGNRNEVVASTIGALLQGTPVVPPAVPVESEKGKGIDSSIAYVREKDAPEEKGEPQPPPSRFTTIKSVFQHLNGLREEQMETIRQAILNDAEIISAFPLLKQKLAQVGTVHFFAGRITNIMAVGHLLRESEASLKKQLGIQNDDDLNRLLTLLGKHI